MALTNAQMVQELCRQIRGVAINYPDGLEAIRACVAEFDEEEAPSLSERLDTLVDPNRRRPGRPRKEQP